VGDRGKQTALKSYVGYYELDAAPDAGAVGLQGSTERMAAQAVYI
jgi:hypothetical protein